MILSKEKFTANIDNIKIPQTVSESTHLQVKMKSNLIKNPQEKKVSSQLGVYYYWREALLVRAFSNLSYF
jgi:hypothetical protein